jgi:hypothetical protein
MVLLQSSGDANNNRSDLTSAAHHLVRAEAPPVMETSVGLYQAVDVALDEMSGLDGVTPTRSGTDSLHGFLMDDRPQSQPEKSLVQKAAALVAAATLSGSMVWMSRTARHDNHQRSTAKNRLAIRD